MNKKFSHSIRAKGTIAAIGILLLSCLISFAIMSVVFLAFYKRDDLTVLETHKAMSFLTLFSLLICLAFGSLLLYLALRRISKPVIQISEAANEVAKGNFSVKVEVKGKDEIGTLAVNFNKMTDELMNMEYLRKDFISNVSHEFKTPIASIQGFAEMLQDKSLSAEQFEQYTNIIIEESKRLSRLSTNMLKISKLDHQIIPEKATKFSLDEQIRKTVVLLEDQWSKKQLSFDLDLEVINYKGAEALVQQIWVNLIENAIKFSHESGLISISAIQTDEEIIVEVKDYGVGIDEESQQRIFEKFYQSDTSHEKEGNGLGLAIVQKIVEMCNGSIQCSSKIGVGTSFIVKLAKKQL